MKSLLEVISDAFYNRNVSVSESEIEAVRLVLALDRAGYVILNKEHNGTLD